TESGLLMCLREQNREFARYHKHPDRQLILPEFAPEEAAPAGEAGGEVEEMEAPPDKPEADADMPADSDKPEADKPDEDKPEADQPDDEKAGDEKPSADKPEDETPADGDEPAAEKPEDE